jgi:hypothetical protein
MKVGESHWWRHYPKAWNTTVEGVAHPTFAEEATGWAPDA